MIKKIGILDKRAGQILLSTEYYLCKSMHGMYTKIHLRAHDSCYYKKWAAVLLLTAAHFDG